jgi:hypothetical protein
VSSRVRGLILPSSLLRMRDDVLAVDVRLIHIETSLLNMHKTTERAQDKLPERQAMAGLLFWFFDCLVVCASDTKLLAHRPDVGLPYRPSFELCWAGAGWDALPIRGDKDHCLASV